MLAFIGMPGPTELLIIGGIMLLLFGSRLPSVMRSLGGSITAFKQGINDIDPTEDLRKAEREIKQELHNAGRPRKTEGAANEGSGVGKPAGAP